MKYFRLLMLSLALLILWGAQNYAEEAETVFSEYRPQVEDSVKQGLDFLLGEQKDDGSFDGEQGETTGVVALCGMAFLSTGSTPGEGPYHEAIGKCIDYVLEHQKDDGMLCRNPGNGKMYGHSISTLFLCEVSGMVDEERQLRIDRALSSAIRLILRAQRVPKEERHRGGWRYAVTAKDSDLSCSGWALMALRSARLNGAPVPDQAIEDAVEYVFKNHDKESGEFGYQDPRSHSDSLTGMALLCLELCGRHGDPATHKAGKRILNRMAQLPGNQFETYGVYYNAQGMFQLGGSYWSRYAQWMYGHYLEKQQEDGSWKMSRGGPTYNTAMTVLALTVPYRQLPIYQRDETVDEETE